MLLSGAAAIGLGSAVSPGALVVNMTALTATNGALITNGGKTVTLVGTGIGTVITMQVQAVITPDAPDGDPGNEGFGSSAGSFLSTGGSIKGNLTATRGNQAQNPQNPGAGSYNATGSSNGSVVDLDGDGDSDVGSNNPADPTGYFTARANATDSDGGPTTGPVFGQVHNFARAVFTVTASGDFTDVNWRIRDLTQNGFVWYENGALNAKDPTSSPYSTGAAVHIVGVPEPTTLGVASLGLLGLVSRRRKA